MNKIESDFLNQPPPQAIDLEEAVLGGIMLERQGQIIALEKLTPADFYQETHAEIFRAIAELAHDGNPIDMRTVVNQLTRNGKLKSIGGAYMIASLTSKVSSTANLEYHCVILVQKRIARDIIQFAARMQREAYAEGDALMLLNEITAFPSLILDKMKSGSESHIQDLVVALVQDINTRQSDAKDITGVPSGYQSLDKIVAGFQPGTLVLIAARPGMGKTTLALNFARNAAIDFQMPVAIFTLEMSAMELGMKLVSMETEMDNRDLKSKIFNSLDMDHFMHSTRKLATAPIYVDDTPAISIMDLRVKCRRMVERYKVKMIIVDYLQLMRGEFHTLKNREQEISSISRGLKLIAKELSVPVLAMAQLSREVDKRPLPRVPMLSDLRESGSLEQDADIVMFIWRPDYYKIPGDPDGTYAEGLTKLIIAKHRGGPQGESYVAMIGKTSKFKGLDSPFLAPAGSLPVKAFFNNQVKVNKDDVPF
ncbi:MAG: replicative DNA helicase [Chryseolinea sp.]